MYHGPGFPRLRRGASTVVEKLVGNHHISVIYYLLILSAAFIDDILLVVFFNAVGCVFVVSFSALVI